MSFSDHTQSGAPDLSVGYAAALGSAALFDRSAAGRIRIRGADRAAWLQGLVTNDVAALRPGHGCYAAFLTAQGRMISDMRVLAFEHSLLLDVPDSTKDAVLNRLDQFVITEDVALADETLSTARFTVFGPAGAALLAQALAGRDVGAEGEWIRALEALPEHGHLSAPSGQGGLVVARAWELGNSGFDVYCESNRRQSVWAAFTAGAMVPALGDAWQTLRIEAGIPTFGTDMDEETIPLEAGIERRAISETKGCYVGQEIVVRILHRGQGRVARKLVGLMADGLAESAQPLAAGSPILAEGGSVAGRVTSTAYSPRLNRWVALGYVHRDLATPETRLRLEVGTTVVPVRVAPLPFVGPAGAPPPTAS